MGRFWTPKCQPGNKSDYHICTFLCECGSCNWKSIVNMKRVAPRKAKSIPSLLQSENANWQTAPYKRWEIALRCVPKKKIAAQVVGCLVAGSYPEGWEFSWTCSRNFTSCNAMFSTQIAAAKAYTIVPFLADNRFQTRWIQEAKWMVVASSQCSVATVWKSNQKEN